MAGRTPGGSARDSRDDSRDDDAGASPDSPRAKGRGGGPRPPGDARRLILDATFELLAGRGYAGASVEAISAAAGVSKATVYRYWPSKSDLVADSIRSLGSVGPLAETDDARADMVALLSQFGRMLTSSPTGRLLPRLLSAATEDPALAETWRSAVIAPRREGVARIVRRAVDQGQLHAGTDVDLVVDVLIGPFYYRHLVTGAAVVDLPAALVALVWDGDLTSRGR